MGPPVGAQQQPQLLLQPQSLLQPQLLLQPQPFQPPPKRMMIRMMSQRVLLLLQELQNIMIPFLRTSSVAVPSRRAGDEGAFSLCRALSR